MNSAHQFRLAVIFAVTPLVLTAGGWEEKEKYHYLEEKKKKTKPDQRLNAKRILKILAPATSIFKINPDRANQVVAQRGTRVTIPKDGIVTAGGRPCVGLAEIVITEVIDPLDFVSAGVDLTYINPQGKLEYFQSAGMFKIDVRTPEGDRLALAPGSKVEVEFPNVKPGDEFYVYRHDANMKWKLHGHNQEIDGGALRIGTRRYSIDAFDTWWNFDKPVPEAACAKGRVAWEKGTPATPFSVNSIGVSYKGAFRRHVDKADTFKVNVHKATIARFLVLDNSGRVGISDPVAVWNKTGFDGAEESAANQCQDIGTIEVKRIDETILSDKKRLSEYLGLEVREYKVDYNRPAPNGP